jgi:hypothetical protein
MSSGEYPRMVDELGLTRRKNPFRSTTRMRSIEVSNRRWLIELTASRAWI